MIDIERIKELRSAALKTIELKTKEAANTHDWVVDAHILTSWELLELLRFAELGIKTWKNAREVDQGRVG